VLSAGGGGGSPPAESAPAMAVAFALAARAAMVHLGHSSASLGVAMGKVVTMSAGMQQRCEWGMIGEAVARAERLAEAADAEVLCDLRVRHGVGALIDFDPVPHASGDDTARARNLAPGALDAILSRKNSRSYDDTAGVFANSSAMGYIELEERGKAAGNGLALGSCVLMPADTLVNYGKTDNKAGAGKENASTTLKKKNTLSLRAGGGLDSLISSTVSGGSSGGFGGVADKAGGGGGGAVALPASAVMALSYAAAACAAAETLANAADHRVVCNNLPAVGVENTLVAARRVVAEAQEAMAPRLLYIEGPRNSGKSRAASAVLDTPEVRRMWLIRVRGINRGKNAERGAGAGGATDTRALSSFIRVFHQLIGFAEETSSRQRKNAIVELLERCGSGMERFGRYAKPILELLELEEPEGYGANAKRPVKRKRELHQLDDGGKRDDPLGMSLSSPWATSVQQLSGLAGRVDSITRSSRPSSGSEGSPALHPTSRQNSFPDPHGIITEGGGAAGGKPQGGSPRAAGIVAAAAHAALTQKSASSLASQLSTSRQSSMRSGLGLGVVSKAVLDAASVAAVNAACKFLSPVATAALLDDGFGHDYIPLEKLSTVDEDFATSEDEDDEVGLYKL
jgi:hypothetical protein